MSPYVGCICVLGDYVPIMQCVAQMRSHYRDIGRQYLIERDHIYSPGLIKFVTLVPYKFLKIRVSQIAGNTAQEFFKAINTLRHPNSQNSIHSQLSVNFFVIFCFQSLVLFVDKTPSIRQLPKKSLLKVLV